MADRVGQQLGNYTLLRLLGRGGQAEVYLGEHRYLKSEAALKVLHASLDETLSEQFLAEAQTLARLVHPAIVRVLDFTVEQGAPVLIMDYAAAGTMRQRYPVGTCLPLATVVSAVSQVASALHYAHRNHVIHRDVKPENLLLGPRDEVLLSDFGLCVFAPSPELLSTQVMAGTLPYMAPEQLQGHPGFASDQYSLAIVTYEWLTGKRPFAGTQWQLIQQHLEATPPPLRQLSPSVSQAVEAVVRRALSKDPQERYVSVLGFAQALARAAQASVRDQPVDSLQTVPLQQNTHVTLETTAVQPLHEQVVPLAQSHTPEPDVAPTQEKVTLSSIASADTASGVSAPRVAIVRPKQQRSAALVGVLVFLILVLVIGGSFGIWWAATTAQINSNATATIQANSNTTATAQTNATATAQVVATVTTSEQRYANATSGTPVIDDPLIDNSRGYNWTHGTIGTSAGTCGFSGGAYHMIPFTGNWIICGPYSPHPTSADYFSDLAFQVQMTFIQGDTGGIVFRADTNSSRGYVFYITSEGSYTLFKFDSSSNTRTELLGGSSSAIKTGLNQSNLLAVLAQGNTIILYVNNQYISSIVDDTYNSGIVVLYASASSTNPANIQFNNAKVWTLS